MNPIDFKRRRVSLLLPLQTHNQLFAFAKWEVRGSVRFPDFVLILSWFCPDLSSAPSEDSFSFYLASPLRLWLNISGLLCVWFLLYWLKSPFWTLKLDTSSKNDISMCRLYRYVASFCCVGVLVCVSLLVNCCRNADCWFESLVFKRPTWSFLTALSTDFGN